MVPAMLQILMGCYLAITLIGALTVFPGEKMKQNPEAV